MHKIKDPVKTWQDEGCTMNPIRAAPHAKRLRRGDLGLLVHTQTMNCKETFQPLPAL